MSIPQRVGPYEIIEEFEPGAFGTVFKAEHPNLKRFVAIKRLKNRADGKAEKRFEREIREIAKLDHPNIVSVIDVGRDGGSPYIVMEYANHGDLKKFIESNSCNLSLSCECIRQVATGLQEAYEVLGVVHRDIKPGNILVTGRYQNNPRFLLADFGLLGIIPDKGRAPFSEDLTKGDIVGTADYMSPEQLTSQKLDVRSDIFSLGCVFFWLLTKQSPYLQFIHRVNDEARKIREVRPELSETLENIISKMLAKDREQRYSTPAEVVNALNEFFFQQHSPRFATSINHRLYDVNLPSPQSDPVRCFLKRDDANPDMCEQIAHHDHLVFVGISHQKLAPVYLSEVLRSHSSTSLPWKRLEVVYARDDVGNDYEEPHFLDNLKLSRQNIAALLMENTHRLPDFKELIFRQSQHRRMQGGSIFGLQQGSGNTTEFKVMYLSNALSPHIPDHSLTFKFEVPEAFVSCSPLLPDELTAGILEAYSVVSDNSQELGTFQSTIWDKSVNEWKDFCSTGVQIEGMQHLIDFAAFAPEEKILELGCGTGELSRMILESAPSSLKSDITLLDLSPVMLKHAKSLLGGEARYALCGVPTSNQREDIDIEGEKYDTILLHFTLSSIAPRLSDLGALVRWCTRYLKPEGRVVISAHNTIVKIKMSSVFNPIKDPLRISIRENSNVTSDNLRKKPRSRFAENGVTTVFEQEGFVLEKSQNIQLSMPLTDRRKMWKVPAVIDSIIDVQSTGLSESQNIIEKAFSDAASDLRDDERIIKFWEFKYDSVSQ